MTSCALILGAGGANDRADQLLRLVAGRPLLGHAIALARSCGPEATVCVCSGDTDVRAFARREGVAAEEADAACATACGGRPTLWVSPLFPLLRTEHLREAARALVDHAAAFAAVEAEGPFWWQEDGNAGASRERRTGGRFLVQTGAFFGMRTAPPDPAGQAVPADAAPVVLPRECALRADTPADLCVVEALLRDRQATAAAAALPNPLGAIVFDFDGVFTDNRVLVFEDGREAAVCDRADGWGLGQLRKHSGVPVLVLSTERNPIVRQRCKKLNLECIHDVPDKLPVLRDWLGARRIDPTSVAYVGNDLNDLSCMRAVGCPVAVADAYPQVKAAARIVLTSPGGKGAVREFTEIVVAAGAERGPL